MRGRAWVRRDSRTRFFQVYIAWLVKGCAGWGASQSGRAWKAGARGSCPARFFLSGLLPLQWWRVIENPDAPGKPFGGRQDSGSGLRCGQRVCWQMWRGAWGPFWEAPFGESPPKGYGTLTFLQQKCNFPMLFLIEKAESYARLIKILYGQKAWKLLPKTAILQTVYSFRTVYGDDWEHFGEFVLSWHMNCTR